MRAYILIPLAVGLAACGPAKQPDLAPAASRELVRGAPGWYLNPPEDASYLLASATATSRDMQVALEKAELDARNQLAQRVDTKFEGVARRFQQETGVADSSEMLDEFTNAYKGIVSTTLVGSRSRRREVKAEGDIFRAWVLMELPVGEASKQLVQKIQASQRLITRARATEAFKELQEEVDRMERSQRAEKAQTPPE